MFPAAAVIPACVVVLNSFPDNELDFIYIDGNHTYHYVIKDLEISWKKIKDDGILCGHDFVIPDVAKAVLEFAERNNLKIITNLRDGDWVLIKKEVIGK